MATISITIPDAQVARVQAAFGKRIGSETPASAAQIKAEIVSFVRGVVRKIERDAIIAGADSTIVDVDVT